MLMGEVPFGRAPRLMRIRVAGGEVWAVKVLVVTEIRLYRDGVAHALRQLGDVRQTSTAATGADAVVTARQDDCDVVLLDMSMPDSLATVKALVTARPGLKVVALGVLEDGPQVIACAAAGISGYISREATLEELGEALRRVLKGEAAVSGRVAAGLMRYIACHGPASYTVGVPHQLTPRECDVLNLLEAGMTNKEIARALDLQLSTVKNHVHNLLAKSGVSGRGEIVNALRRSGQHTTTA